MTGWQPMSTAPKDGTTIDLWGEDRSPEASLGLMMVPMPRRWAHCRFGSYMVDRPSGLRVPTEPAWIWDHTKGLERRIWPLAWMSVPAPPTEAEIEALNAVPPGMRP